MWPIETRKVEYQAREKSTFEEADEEAACEESAV